MRFFGEYNRNLRQLDLFKAFSFVMVLVNFFLTISYVSMSNNAKVIITPPYIQSEFENVGNSFSLSYYEQIGNHLANGLLTISPETVDRTFDSIQGYFATDPDDVKQIKEYLIKEAERVKKDNIYQAFYYLKTLQNHQHNSFVIQGLLKTMTGNVMLEERKVQIEFKYVVNNKKIVIKSFEVR